MMMGNVAPRARTVPAIASAFSVKIIQSGGQWHEGCLDSPHYFLTNFIGYFVSICPFAILLSLDFKSLLVSGLR